MNNATKSHLIDARVQSQGIHCAWASVLVANLPNTVLVQLVGTPLGGRRAFSLYSVYREETMTFDAICRFALRPLPRHRTRPPLDQTLRRYLATVEFKRRVLDPLVQEVQAHFGR